MKLDIRLLVQSFLMDESKNYMVVRHYNMLNLDEKELGLLEVEGDTIFMFYSFQNAGVMDPYTPLLPWVKQIYEEKYKERYTVSEFLEVCGVYYLHRCIFEKYFLGERIERKEEVVQEELKFEKRKILENFEKIFLFITQEYRLFAVIQHIHLADICFFHLLHRLMQNVKYPSFKMLLFFNDQFRLTVEKKKHWDVWYKYVLEQKLEYEWVDKKQLKDEVLSRDFVVDKKHIEEYEDALNSLKCFYAFYDVMEYIKPVYENMDAWKKDIDLRYLQKISFVYIHTAILMGDINNAALAIEKVSKLCDFDECNEESFYYYYFKALNGFQIGKVDEVRKNSKKAIMVAEKLQNEVLLIKAKIFNVMSSFAGWKELYLCDFSFDVDEEFVEELKNKKYYNSLAYIYCFGYDHDTKVLQEIAEGKREPVYFNRAVAIGEYIGDNDFLMTAYMKNIIIYNKLNCQDYVNEMYKKRMNVIRKEGDEVRIAHVYGGLSYNATIQEKFEEADTYLNESVSILNRHAIPDETGEALYNIAVNCFVAGMYKEAVRSLEILYTVLEKIGLMSIRLCGACKLYVLSALSYHYLGEKYNCYRYFLKIETIVRVLLEKEDKETFTNQELMYYYASKMVLSKNETPEVREKLLKKVEYYFQNDKAEQYIFLAILAQEYFEFLLEQGREDEAEAYLKDKIEFCKKNKYFVKQEQLEYLLARRKMPPKKYLNIGLKSVTEAEILKMATIEGIKTQLREREKEINFLRIWQEILNRDDLVLEELQQKAIGVLQTTYGLDSVISFQKDEDEYVVTYMSPDLEIEKVDMDKIYRFMSEYKHSFVCQWVDKNYFEFAEVEDAFEGKKRSTLIGVYHEKNKSITLCAITIGDNIAIHREVINEKNLFIIEFAIEQMDVTLERIRSRQMLAKMKEELEKMAVTDNLTGLYNRQGFNLKMREEEQSKRDSVQNVLLYIDLDNFKYYNDTFGHEIGDLVLIQFAKIFRESIRKKGYAVRYGGDEFVLVLQDSNEQEALDVVHQIYETISDGFKGLLSEKFKTTVLIPANKRISCSIGIAKYTTGNKNNMLDALSKADKLLYEVKKDGKGRFAMADS